MALISRDIDCAARDQRSVLECLCVAAQDAFRERDIDASEAIVLVPHPALLGETKRAWARAAGGGALLLPRITTLRHLAQDCLAREATPPMTPLARLSWLARELQRAGLVTAPPARRANAPQATSLAAWRLARGVARLVDGLTEAAYAAGTSVQALSDDSFIHALARAHGTANVVAQRLIEAESRIVFSVWQALVNDAQQRDPSVAYFAALNTLTTSAMSPLVVLDYAGVGVRDDDVATMFDPVLQRFAHAYAQGVPVYVLRAAPLAPIRETVLRAAWGRADSIEMSTAAIASMPAWQVLACRSIEDEARAGVVQLHAWRAQGIESIAVVAQDRAAARRLRALLERDGVLLEDEGGWRLSTTSAAAAVMRWFDLAVAGAGQADYRDVLECLKSPFMLSDVAPDQKQAALQVIEEAIGHYQAGIGIGRIARAVAMATERTKEGTQTRAQTHDQTHDLAQAILSRVTDGLATLARFETSAARLPSLPEWFDIGLQSLAAMGLKAALEADIAGLQVLATWQKNNQDAQGVHDPVPFAVWRALFGEMMEAAAFRDTRVESPIKLVQLETVLLREWDAVLLVGADVAHLLPPPPDLPLVKSVVRRDFGLPGMERVRAEMQVQLAWLFSATPQVTMTWQAKQGTQDVPVAPELALLDRAARAHWGQPLIAQHHDVPRLDAATMEPPHAAVPVAAPHLVGAAQALLPTRVSVSAYASLIACPYQFFARSVLGLRTPEGVRLEADARDIGLWIHRVLHRLHQQLPRLSELPFATIRATFEQAAQEEARMLIGADYLAVGWLARFATALPQYVAWQCAREAAGWLWHTGEENVETGLPRSSEEEPLVTLYGRIDRIDMQVDQAGSASTASTGWAVLDYKTHGEALSKHKLAQLGEDPQLAAYALLWAHQAPNMTINEACYVPLAPDRLGALGKTVHLQPALLNGKAEEERLVRLFKKMAGGAALPANAAESICTHCEMRGICRRPERQVDGADGADGV